MNTPEKISSAVPAKKEDSRIAVLRNTVAQGLNNHEFAMLLEVVKATKLNPFKREIWAIKTKDYVNRAGQKIEGKVQIFTGFMGFLEIANKHPQYDGCECEVVRKEDGKIDYAECKVFRKDRSRPTVARVYWSEFYKPGFNGKESTWDKMPSVMITKVAKSHAHREAFPQELGGHYIPEEMEEGREPKLSFEDVAALDNVKEQEIVEADVETVLADLDKEDAKNEALRD